MQREVDLFFRQEYPTLVKALRLFLPSPQAAEDVAQEAMARAYRDWHQVRKFDAPRAWLYRVAFNLAKSSLRRRAIEVRFARIERTRRIDESVQMERITLRQDLRKALKELPRRQRQALILRYYLEMTIDETSVAMDCPAGTVKTLSHRGLATLRETWHKAEEENSNVL